MLTLEFLKQRRESLVADLCAVQGAIQLLDELIIKHEETEQQALTLDGLAQKLGAQSAEVVKK